MPVGIPGRGRSPRRREAASGPPDPRSGGTFLRKAARSSPSVRADELQPHDAAEQAEQEGDSTEGGGILEEDDADRGRAEGADAGPDGVGGPERDRPRGPAEQDE